MNSGSLIVSTASGCLVSARGRGDEGAAGGADLVEVLDDLFGIKFGLIFVWDYIWMRYFQTEYFWESYFESNHSLSSIDSNTIVAFFSMKKFLHVQQSNRSIA